MRFLFDAHMHQGACQELRRRGVDVEHAVDEGLRTVNDAKLLAYATNADRIVTTRNYRDFQPLAGAYARAGKEFPGILLVFPSIPEGDAGGLVRALEQWIESCPPGTNPVQNTSGYLLPAR